MIKTINLLANEEQKIDVCGGTHVKIKNLGENTVYVSKNSSIVAGADNVKSVQGNTTDILVDVATYYSKENTFNWYGTIYALAESDCSIELETTNNANFKNEAKGSDKEIAELQSAITELACDTDTIKLELDEKLSKKIIGDIDIIAYMLTNDNTVDEPSSGYINFKLDVLENGEDIATARHVTIGYSDKRQASLGTSLSNDCFDVAYIDSVQCRTVVAKTKVTTQSLVVQNDITAVTCDFTNVTIDNTLSLQLTDGSGYINVAEQLGNILTTDIIANKTLPNLYDSRPTSANIEPTGSGGLATFKATSAMTEGKPATGDGHIIHFYWDSTGGYDSQIFIKGGATSCIQFRSSSKGVWTNWYTVLDSSNYTNYTYSKDDIKTAINALASRLAKLDGGASSLL